MEPAYILGISLLIGIVLFIRFGPQRKPPLTNQAVLTELCDATTFKLHTGIAKGVLISKIESEHIQAMYFRKEDSTGECAEILEVTHSAYSGKIEAQFNNRVLTNVTKNGTKWGHNYPEKYKEELYDIYHIVKKNVE